MADVVPPAKRSQMMSGIRRGDTRPELTVRKMLFALGYRFRLHVRGLPGSPDIVMPGRRIVIFVHGCFWHRHEGCRYATSPATRPEFWSAKFERNVARDKEVLARLSEAGWRVLLVWECALRRQELRELLPGRLQCWVEGPARTGEIGTF